MLKLKSGKKSKRLNESNDLKNEITREFLTALYDNNVDTVMMLLREGVDPDLRDENGEPALMCASWTGQTDMVELLLDAGADPNIKDMDEGWTSLMVACKEGHKEIVKELLETGADPNIVSKQGLTAIAIAASECDTDIIKMLLQNGAEVDPNDKLTIDCIVENGLDQFI